MHRSILYQMRRHISGFHLMKSAQNASIPRCTQSVFKSSPSSTVLVNSFHSSLRCEAEDSNSGNDDQKLSKSQKRKRNARLLLQEDQELESAAVNAAKSLPGDWTRTADDLMTRLSMQAESQESGDSATEQPPDVKSSLLSTMTVGRSFERPQSGNMGRNGHREDRRSGVQEKYASRKRLARKWETFASIYSQPRLGIFDEKKLKADAGKDVIDENNLWQVVSKEKSERARGSLPRNGFEEMIQWTKEGRMWTFPINNEEDMREERQYEFHEHVFLSHHLGQFPSDGPLRRFMDLVIIGLCKNPWISVPEKVEHIHWFADYFREKQKLLESSIGDKAKMKQS